jgi:four helix bundle protein
MFQHDNLHVYQLALSFRADVEEVLQAKMAGRSALANQLERAATSVVLNIAEGAGRSSEMDKAHFYSIAIGSASECAAAYDVFLIARVVESVPYHETRRKLSEISAMLVGMRKTMMRKSGVKKLAQKINK